MTGRYKKVWYVVS